MRLDPVWCRRSWSFGFYFPEGGESGYWPRLVVYLGPLILWVISDAGPKGAE